MNLPRNPRVLPALATTLLLAACGSPAAPAAHASQTAGPSSAATARPAETASATPSAAPSAAPSPTPTPAPPAPPALIAVTQPGTGNVMTIRLLRLDGSAVASTSVPSNGTDGIDGWVKVGPDGAYWLSGGVLHRLGRDGAVTDVATIPRGSLFAVGPNGQIAYSDMIGQTPPARPGPTSSRSSSTAPPRCSPTGRARGRERSPASAASGIPQYNWYYDPVTWTGAGIVIARLPQGGCGCGSFGMDSVQGYTAIVDPTTGVAGSVMDDTSCPLSGIAADGLTACFHTPEVRTSKNEGLGADAVNLLSDAKVTQTFSLSTQNSGGDAVFTPDATELAYATAPASLDCGTWQGKTQMRVLNLVTGSAGPVGPLGLQPVAWLPDGRILATDTTVSSNGDDLTGTMIVDPATGTVTPLPSTTTGTTTPLGVVTG